MPLLLSEAYCDAFPDSAMLAALSTYSKKEAAGKSVPKNAINIGIINIMPEAKGYEPFLLRALGVHADVIRPLWIRLESHGYSSTDPQHIAQFYRSFEAVCNAHALHALIITGAPVETIPFEQVHYWQELSAIIDHARRHIPSTLGICWGGMALAQRMGVETVQFAEKMFGVFPTCKIGQASSLVGSMADRFFMPQSRHSGLQSTTLEELASDQQIRLLAQVEGADYTLIESVDQRFCINLGHFEYSPQRLLSEMQRDAERSDVQAPYNFPHPEGKNIWREQRIAFFGSWLKSCQRTNF